MKNTTWQQSSLIVLSFLLLTGFTEETSQASSVSVGAEISWSSLSITGTGQVSVYNPTSWTSSRSRAGTYTEWAIPTNPYVFNSSDLGIGYDFDTYAISNNMNAESFAETNPDFIITSAMLSAAQYDECSSISTAQRDIYYNVTSSGNVNFSIDYSLDMDIDATDGYAWADVLAFTYLSHYNPTTNQWEIVNSITEENALTNIVSFEDYTYNIDSGQITFSYYATSGEYLHLTAGVTAKASTASAVPVPGAIWLLGPGLAGLIAFRRRNAN